MAEPIQFMFDHREVVELLVKKQDLRDGLWMLSIEFIQAAVTVPGPPDGKTLQPAALNIVSRIGLKKHEGEPNNLTIDAAEVNPPARFPLKVSKKGPAKQPARKK